MEQLRNEFSLTALCRALDVERSGYYAGQKRQRAPRRYAELAAAIGALFHRFRSIYGAPRIHDALRTEGWTVSRRTVARRMAGMGLVAKAAKKFKATTQSRHDLPVAPNLLHQDFAAAAPNQKWVSDITYIWTREGWLDLAVVMDLYSRAIVGWSMAERITRQLVCDALTMALWRRKPKAGLVAHSDRGSQYCSGEYQGLLSAHGIQCSMRKKGDCHDNAAMESFFHSLTVEWVHGADYATRVEAKPNVFEYIEVFDNRQRSHSTLNYCSPWEFEAPAA